MIKNILIIEDDDNLASILSNYLKAKDYLTQIATNQKQALGKFSSDTDICIVDTGLYNAEIFTLVKELKNKVNGMPFIYISNKTTTAKIQADDIDEIIEKPFTLNDILANIEKIKNK